MSSKRQRRYVIAGVVLAAALAVAAVAAREPAAGPPAEPAATAGQSSPMPVIVPGRPGETAAVIPSDELEAPDGSAYNALDVWFVRMMIPHHAQALEMAALAPDRAGSPGLRALAERISTAQGPEIAVLRAWLDARSLAESDPDHPHDQMPGMQSPEAIEALAAATGDAFDRLFVDMMSEHHQGAVDMATEVLRVGVDEQVQRLASGIAIEQSVEITRMRELV